MERKTKKNYSPLRILTFSSSGRWWVWIIEACCLNAYFFFVVFSTCLCVETKNRGPISRTVLQSNGIFSLLRSVTYRAFPRLENCVKDSPLQTMQQQLISDSAFFNLRWRRRRRRAGRRWRKRKRKRVWRRRREKRRK